MNKLKIKAIAIFISLICLISVMAPIQLAPYTIFNNQIFGADNVELKIMIGDSTIKRQHMAISVGKTSEKFRFKLTNALVKSASYKSTNEDAFKIVNSGKNECYVKAESEGVGNVVLTVKDSGNKTHTAKVFVSSCAEIEDADGYIKRNNVNVYMGASEKTEATNYEIKGTVNANQKVRIWTRCGNFYCLDVPGKTFKDGKTSGFIKKSDISVPISGIKIEKKNIELMEDKEYCVDLVGVPSYCDEKDKIKASWSSSDRYVAPVTREAVIYGYNQGKCVITATYGKYVAKCNVTVIPKKETAPTKPRYLCVSKLTKKYRYSFVNDHPYFKRNYYYLNEIDKELLINKAFDYRNALGDNVLQKKNIAQKVYEKIKGIWRGSCYGMCVSMLENRAKDINVRKYTGMTKGKKYQLKKVKEPRKSARVESLINYYQNSYSFFESPSFYPDSNNIQNTFEKGLRTLYNYASNNIACELELTFTQGGRHAVISLGVDKKTTKKSKKWIYINIYDPNCGPENWHACISKDYKYIKIPCYGSIEEIALQPDLNKFKLCDIDN